MYKNPVCLSVLRRLRLFTLMSFIQFAVINDGYTYFLTGLQPMHPAASIVTVLAITVDLQQRLALRESLSIVTETHRVITQATSKSLKIIERIVKSGWERRGKAVSWTLSSAWDPARGLRAEGERAMAQRENYIGGKKESWTKFDAPSIERFMERQFSPWEMSFVDEIIAAAQSALSRDPRPDLERRKSMQRIHHSPEGDPESAISKIGTIKSPSSSHAGWFFYYRGTFALAGAVR